MGDQIPAPGDRVAIRLGYANPICILCDQAFDPVAFGYECPRSPDGGPHEGRVPVLLIPGGWLKHSHDCAKRWPWFVGSTLRIEDCTCAQRLLDANPNPSLRLGGNATPAEKQLQGWIDMQVRAEMSLRRQRDDYDAAIKAARQPLDGQPTDPVESPQTQEATS